jgi:HK97 family phage prohead protease
MAKYDHIDFKPPAGAREEAKRGLEWRSEHGRGGTAVGIARARDISNGKSMSPETVRRMKAFFDRHQSDKSGEGWSPGEDGYPSNGRIAHALWGGTPGYSWSKKVVRQMNAADERSEANVASQRTLGLDIEQRSLSVEDTADFPLLSIETRSEEIEQNGEKREVRRDWIVGYAARFGVNSLDLGDFVERIDPSAFKIVTERRGRKKPLETRALFNHDPNHVLGRHPDTLKLFVDEKGLRYEVLPPESRAEIVESIRRGDVRGSSFSFVIAEGGESWSNEEGRSVRTVTKIEALYDVGPVTYPAYPDSDVNVAKRSYSEFMSRTEKRDENKEKRRKAMSDLKEYIEKHGG